MAGVQVSVDIQMVIRVEAIESGDPIEIRKDRDASFLSCFQGGA
jgi:hypothetical protein